MTEKARCFGKVLAVVRMRRVRSFCQKHGHNVRSCPQLATKLLKAVQAKHSAKQILEVVSQDSVTVHGVRHKATSSMRSIMKCVHKGSRAMSSSRTQTQTYSRTGQPMKDVALPSGKHWISRRWIVR